MKILLKFISCILSMPGHWVVWIAGLVVVNLLLPLFLVATSHVVLAPLVVIGFFLLGAGIQMWIFQRLGFVRLLGLGHFGWFLMLPWLVLQYPEPLVSSTLFGWWLVSILVLDGVSLLIDVVDVVRYLSGDRAPSVAC